MRPRETLSMVALALALSCDADIHDNTIVVDIDLCALLGVSQCVEPGCGLESPCDQGLCICGLCLDVAELW